MAIVADLAGVGTYNQDGRGLDRKLASPNRQNAGSPLGSLTPLYPGELVLDTTNTQMWVGSMAPGATTWNTSSWTPVVRVV